MLRNRKPVPAAPEVGEKAPELHLPSAQGGQLRLTLRTARGPAVVISYRPWAEEDVAYFRALSELEQEFNVAGATVLGFGVAEPDGAREFARGSGIQSYVLYDYARVEARRWGLLEKDKEHGEYSRPAAFLISSDHEVIHSWVADRPDPAELLAKVSELTGLPKPAEEEGEEGEKPKKPRKAKKGESRGGEASEQGSTEGSTEGSESQEQTEG